MNRIFRFISVTLVVSIAFVCILSVSAEDRITIYDGYWDVDPPPAADDPASALLKDDTGSYGIACKNVSDSLSRDTVKYETIKYCSEIKVMPEKTRELPATDSDLPHSMEYYLKKWNDLKSNSTIVMSVTLNYGFGEMFAYYKIPDDLEDYNIFKDQMYSRGGFSVWSVTVKNVYKNDSGVDIKAGDLLTVKERFYLLNGILYTQNGMKPHLLSRDEETLVFAEILPEKTITPLVSVDEDIRIDISADENVPENVKARSDYSKLINEILCYYKQSQVGTSNGFTSRILPALLGFGAGILVCVIPATIFVTVRRKKAKAGAARETSE